MSDPASEDAFLRAVTNLSALHRDHETSYASAPREQASWEVAERLLDIDELVDFVGERAC